MRIFPILLPTFLILSTQSYIIQHTLTQLIEKGDNITDDMASNISAMIIQVSQQCPNKSDISCFSQRVGMKVEGKYGKSWNVHAFNRETSVLKGSTFSNGKWLSFIREGKQQETELGYYIYKPNTCAKFINTQTIALEHTSNGKQYWGAKMSDTLQKRVKSLIVDGSAKYGTMEQIADFIKQKMGPGKWQVIIWDSSSMDYLDACIYQSYFGILLDYESGSHTWSYYIGRMSLL